MSISRMKDLGAVAVMLGVIGLGAGVLVRSTAGAAPREAPAVASQPPAQRYQISTWSQPGGKRDTGGRIVPTHGAYILDTQSGKVWQIKEGEKPTLLGGVE